MLARTACSLAEITRVAAAAAGAALPLFRRRSSVPASVLPLLHGMSYAANLCRDVRRAAERHLCASSADGRDLRASQVIVAADKVSKSMYAQLATGFFAPLALTTLALMGRVLLNSRVLLRALLKSWDLLAALRLRLLCRHRLEQSVVEGEARAMQVRPARATWARAPSHVLLTQSRRRGTRPSAPQSCGTAPPRPTATRGPPGVSRAGEYRHPAMALPPTGADARRPVRPTPLPLPGQPTTCRGKLRHCDLGCRRRQWWPRRTRTRSHSR